MKHYTYKVTFPGFPWFYFGVHTDNGKPYFGSPRTHKWVWSFYDCEVQILEWFGTREEAVSVESRLIKHFLNDPNCLNEHYGTAFSLESSKKGALLQPREARVKTGKRVGNMLAKEKRGMFGLSEEYLFESRSRGGKNFDPEKRAQNGIKAASIVHSKKNELGKSEHAIMMGKKSGERATENARKVVRIDEFGGEVVYASAREASEQTGARRNHIGSVCKGERKTAGGYKWRYYG
jgi:hypothetical protein